MPQSNIRRYLRHGTLPQLQVFEAVVRRGNFTRAAEELCLAQPTVSIQLKKLGEMVGLPLIEQVGRQAHPTEAGKCVAQACDRVFSALRELEQQLVNLRQLNGGCLRLAVGTAAECFAPQLLAQFARHHPEISLSLQILNRRKLLERMTANDDDLYLFGNPPEAGEFVKQAILPNPMAVFVRVDHPLAKARQIPFESLAGEAFIFREQGSGTRMAVERMLANHGISPCIRMELSTDEAIRQAIVAGMGISILPRHALGLDTDRPLLTMLDIRDFPGEGHWYLTYSLGKQLSPAALAFIEFIRKNAGNLLDDRTVSRRRADSLPDNARNAIHS